MWQPQFPHVSREISASLLWAGLTLFFLVNVYAKINLTPGFQKELLQALQKPFSAIAHEALARRFRQEGLLSAASNELRLVNVLGISTEDEQAAWASEPARIRANYEYWRSVVAARPDYRDAFLSLAAAAYQLGYFNEAKAAAQTAVTLNPNSSEATRLLQLLTLF